ncbi:MAG: ankyrin repeat domain-containing protein [Spirochaetales bacterium]|nr:ankyrin repeat domain-containing protein [Spirochaetales bacterium]MCF7937940.1 ankyrin repeat domain-containing protein [Spirochaetales bacterium]
MTLLCLSANMWHANQEAYTPFMAAAGRLEDDLLSHIINDYGGTEERINQADQYGWTALFSAASRGKTENLRLLVEKGGNTRIRTERGENISVDEMPFIMP